MEPRDRPPGNVQHLTRLVEQSARELAQTALELRSTIANTIVAQMLPEGAVKGGSAMKLRLGEVGTRFTPDLDFVRRQTLEQFELDLSEALEQGWGGFTAKAVAAKPASPAGVPAAYVMRPYEIKLKYLGRSWLTVRLEVGHDELGDTDDPPAVMADEIVEVFAGLGLPVPAAVPVVAVHHQVAQKLHACTSPGSQRAHDLVDLQRLVATQELDLPLTRNTCERLFALRKLHLWPPALEPGSEWDTLYAAAAQGVPDVAVDSATAADWGRCLIERIAAA